MNIIGVKKVSNTHCEYEYKHRMNKGEKKITIKVVALTPERAITKAWDEVRELRNFRKSKIVRSKK